MAWRCWWKAKAGRGRCLLVDAILGQRQVVIKSLEANYRAVPGIAGATVMGDGRVALILDVDVMVVQIEQRARRDPLPDQPRIPNEPLLK